MITTDRSWDGLEIACLRDDEDGIMTTNELGAYSVTVIALLCNETERVRLRAGCRVSAERYTLENMVQRFAEGIANGL